MLLIYEYNYKQILESVNSKLFKSWFPGQYQDPKKEFKVNIETYRENV